jgi:A/G-specific adenine glycosylase
MQASGESIAPNIAAPLLAWYAGNARVLPWRAPPGAPAPDVYPVWLSEVMLQQTTVAHAAPYFERFTRAWPTVEALAAATEDDVMRAWAGLGYYSRARNLIACAREVAASGGFPRDEAGLRRLPGVGPYTAAAIAAIALGARAAPVDANIERVVARLFAIGEPLPRAKPAIRRAAEAVVPNARAGDFAQAMMDLGATVCTPRAPRCPVCPLHRHCRANAQGAPEAYPVKAPKRAKPTRTGTAFWIARGDAVWLVRRPPAGLLGGMRALPDDGWTARRDGSGEAPHPAAWRRGGVVRHGFTHFDFELQLMLCGSIDCARLGSGEWWPTDRLDEAGLPTLFAKAARVALAAQSRNEAAECVLATPTQS